MKPLFIALAVLPIALSGCSQSHPPLAGQKWADALHDPDAKVRRKAAFTLGNIGPSDSAVVPALTQAIRDQDPAVRREVILALIKCGSAAEDAVPALAEMSNRDPDSTVREAAAKAVTLLRE